MVKRLSSQSHADVVPGITGGEVDPLGRSPALVLAEVRDSQLAIDAFFILGEHGDSVSARSDGILHDRAEYAVCDRVSRARCRSSLFREKRCVMLGITGSGTGLRREAELP